MASDNHVMLEVQGLKTFFYTEDGVVPAVAGVDFVMRKGQTLGLVGESGCGKSVTALSILRLIAHPGKIVEGEIRLEGQNLLALEEDEMRRIRGKQIAMIFQEPMTSLNPVYTIGYQIVEAIQVHEKLDKKQAQKRAVEMLHLVGIPSPEERFSAYPHELSGGMRQRVMIAMALSCSPQLLIADEPTTALDVTIQAQILELMKSLKERVGTALLLITHDLGVIAEMAEEVVVMYAGEIVEHADVLSIFKEPRHPYTQGLLSSLPSLSSSRKTPLNVIRGMVPNLLKLPRGCRFAARCP
ncbi:MAG: ABC transporter ATP-binding protein, partial [Dehalococcoidales bacterium]|nr:ABC transporter ATP-binding protein [Dehalococcoidales bacterium]